VAIAEGSMLPMIPWPTPTPASALGAAMRKATVATSPPSHHSLRNK
jgi:hypothetical protein